MGLALLTAPDGEPVSLEQVKAHLRIDIDAEDEILVTVYIPAARQACESYLSRALMTQTWRQTFSCWGCCLELEFPPHQSITSVQYVDANGVTQTLATTEYQVDLSSDRPARIVPAYGKEWPTIREQTLNPITVTFVAGYGAAIAVPGPIVSAMLLLVEHLHKNRGAVNIGNIVNEIPLSVRFLLDPYRVLYA